MNSSGGASAVTDENGKYTLTGLPSRGSVNLYAICPDGLAYVNASRRDNAYSATTPPENADFELSPGIVARGSVTDTAGVPVRARVSYLCLRNNEYAQDMTDSFGSYGSRETDENGDYEIVVIPGQGVITAVANGDREFEKASFEGLGLPLNRGVNNGMLSTINRGIVRGEHYDAVALISPKSLDDEVTVHLKLREGNQVVGRLVDAKGEAVRYAKWWQPERNFGDQLESAEFVVGGLRDGEERRIVFRHEKLRLGAVVEVGKHSKSPVTVKLRPYATITGRLVNKSGQPIAKARYAAITAGTTAKLQESRGQRSALKHRPVVSGEGETDADGRFRIDEIIPGHKCELAAGEPGSRLPRALKQLSLRSGESRDLGDVVLK